MNFRIQFSRDIKELWFKNYPLYNTISNVSCTFDRRCKIRKIQKEVRAQYLFRVNEIGTAALVKQEEQRNVERGVEVAYSQFLLLIIRTNR